MEKITDGDFCSKNCPYIAKWEHPFFHHTAWCWYVLENLTWHDYWLAKCLYQEQSTTMLSVRNAGRTKPPEEK